MVIMEVVEIKQNKLFVFHCSNQMRVVWIASLFSLAKEEGEEKCPSTSISSLSAPSSNFSFISYSLPPFIGCPLAALAHVLNLGQTSAQHAALRAIVTGLGGGLKLVLQHEQLLLVQLLLLAQLLLMLLLDRGQQLALGRHSNHDQKERKKEKRKKKNGRKGEKNGKIFEPERKGKREKKERELNAVAFITLFKERPGEPSAMVRSTDVTVFGFRFSQFFSRDRLDEVASSFRSAVDGSMRGGRGPLSEHHFHPV
jgi:hypothetical protein